MTEETKSQETFESQLNKLQAIVKKMEGGQLPLEESLKQFEEGLLLTQSCQKYLQGATQRVEILLEKKQEE